MAKKQAGSKTEQLLTRFRSEKDRLGLTAEGILEDLNRNYLPKGDSVSYSTICNWLSGRAKKISSDGAIAIEEWLQKNKQ